MNVPRYTSYPAYPFWNGETNFEGLIDHKTLEQGIDLYIHVPFCDKLCFYCGCNRVIGKHSKLKKEYVQALKREYSLLIEHSVKINSIHFGGGTPTSLDYQDFRDLLSFFSPYFSDSFFGSIEIDPRTFRKEYINIFKDFNISRFSLGIQDFDPNVQKHINRIQPVEEVEKVVNQLKTVKNSHINFDLIYGLPGQTEKSICYTLDVVDKLRPEMLAIYSYAHMPRKFDNQKLIKTDILPTPEQKEIFFALIKSILISRGYTSIGLDHYALEGSYLAKAKMTGDLTRNFMGHTDKKSPHLIGLGASAISETPHGQRQNVKEVKEYLTVINEQKLAWFNGHNFANEDLLRKKIIENFMCHHIIKHQDISELENAPNIHHHMKPFLEDGLLTETDEGYISTSIGHKYLRVVASCFDSYFSTFNDGQKFSSSV